MFAFVWLPRDELTTRRRVAIGEMIERAAEGQITNWSVDLGDGDLALLRFTLNVAAKTPTPDVDALDRQLDAMVRGWAPSVEEALGELVGATRATRLTLTYAPAFPQAYRSRYPASDAAQDIVRLDALPDDRERGVRLYRLDIDPESQLRLKIYRRNDIVPLSDVVPVLENFGFHVLKETPTRLEGGQHAHIHEFAVVTSDRSACAPVLKGAEVVESVVEAVLEGRSENDPFNQLLVSAGLAPEGVLLFRAWFRYLRQIGLSYSQVTVVEALRRAPDVAHGLIALFEAMHDPDAQGRPRRGRGRGAEEDRQGARRASRRSTRTGSCACSAA